MASDDQQQDRRPLLRSELDLALMTTNSVWGRAEVSQELRDKIGKEHWVQIPKVDEQGQPVLDEQGQPVYEWGITYQGMWSLLGYYTRDMRLGNLSTFDGELRYTQYYLDLAGDFLQAKEVAAFLICLSRVATQLELSQSKGGFLRKRMNTLTQEHFSQEIEPKKVNLFGKSRGGE